MDNMDNMDALLFQSISSSPWRPFQRLGAGMESVRKGAVFLPQRRSWDHGKRLRVLRKEPESPFPTWNVPIVSPLEYGLRCGMHRSNGILPNGCSEGKLWGSHPAALCIPKPFPKVLNLFLLPHSMFLERPRCMLGGYGCSSGIPKGKPDP